MTKCAKASSHNYTLTACRGAIENLDSQALLKTELDAIRALAFDPLSLKNMLEERITDVGLQQGICKSLAVSIAEGSSYPGLAGLGEENHSSLVQTMGCTQK